MPHKYTAETIWQRNGEHFIDNHYSRKHLLKFDGGLEIIGSSSPSVVPLPYSEVQAVDPEEAFVSAVSSCHMLWFLSIAAHKGYVVDIYHDYAYGIMTKNENNKYWLSSVTLQPNVGFSGPAIPTFAEIMEMHHEAHNECYIANSVKTAITIKSLALSGGRLSS